MTLTPLLYLDIDGTVREGKDDALGRFVNGPEDVRVFPEAVERMREWKAAGGRIAAVTNQGGIALGHVDPQQALAALDETNRQTGMLIDVVSLCPHHPDAAQPVLARCWCRKPRPGLLMDATFRLSQVTGDTYPQHLALMVGDRPEDGGAAVAANVDFLPAAEWREGLSGDWLARIGMGGTR